MLRIDPNAMDRIPAAGFRLLDHTADVGMEAWAPSLEEAFAQAARGTSACMGTPGTGRPAPPFTLEARGIDPGDLLVCLLSEQLAALELEGRYLTGVTGAVVEELPDGEWHAHLSCEGLAIDRDSERELVEVKAVTYHGLEVARDDAGWHLRVVFDL